MSAPTGTTSQLVQRPDGPWRRIAIDVVVLSAVVTVALVLIFHLRSVSLRTPFTYAGDSLGVETSAKMIIQTGWAQTTPRLGAPFGLELYDFPIGGDNAHYFLMKVLSWGTGDWVLLVNAFYLLSFYTAAWSAYLCQRWLRVGRTAAIVTSALFAFAPYHFARGISHLMLASYFIVPIGVLLAMKASTAPLVSATDGSRAARIRHVLPWIALAALAGSCGVYYAVFAILGIVVACAASAAVDRTWRPIGRGAVYSGVIAVTFVLNVSGTLLYRRRHGPNLSAITRSSSELDTYGLRPIQMLTPVPGHWLGPLADIADDLAVGYHSEYMQFLGLTAGVALVAMLAAFLVASLRPHGRGHDARGLLSVTTIVFILVGITGGLAWTLTIVGFNELRAWNRLSIVIMFNVLCWLGLSVGPVIRRWVNAHPAHRGGAFGVAAIVLMFGLADQCSIDDRPNPKTWEASFRSDRDFFTAVEAQLPADSMVYVLPYRQFPEAPPTNGSGDYDLLRPFLQTNTLRWSYGGMKGREADWQQQLTELDPESLLESLVAVGYQGILIDRFGYPDQAAALAEAFRSITLQQPVLSPDGRWYFFDVVGERGAYDASDLDVLRTDLLESPRVVLGGCSTAEGVGPDRFQWCGQDVDAAVSRSRDSTHAYTYSFQVKAPAGAGTLHVFVDGVDTPYSIGADPVAVSVPISGSGDDGFELRTDVPALAATGDPRDLRIQVIAAAVSKAMP